jgi:3-oxoacid CoA-transferase subunit A
MPLKSYSSDTYSEGDLKMIKNWLITGDTHGRVCERLKNIPGGYCGFSNENSALIILGDAGINFYLNKTDAKNKQAIQDTGWLVYCVRGNHEERPENIPTMDIIFDPEVDGNIYVEADYPNIRYFMDGGIYNLSGKKTLVLGGAYSVDKYYRLLKAASKNNFDSWTGWFPEEQLSVEERDSILEKIKGQKFDLVLTHTCPYRWQPVDLFLNGPDQSQVDISMELWLEDVKDVIDWNIWLFGHYHDDRIIRPHVEMFSTDVTSLENIFYTWQKYDEEDEVAWWLNLDPNFYT